MPHVVKHGFSLILGLLLLAQVARCQDSSSILLQQLAPVDTETIVEYDLQPVRQRESRTWLFYTLLSTVLLLTYTSYNFRKDIRAVWIGFSVPLRKRI